MAQTEPRRTPSAIDLTVRIWYDPDEEVIHIAGADGRDFHSTVSNHPASERFHPHLFIELRRLLVSHACWPDGPSRTPR